MNASFHSTRTSASSTFGSPLAWLQQAARAFVAHPSSASAGLTQPQIHVLDAGATVEVAQLLQHELVCLHGRLWITHDHAPIDVVIERGQCYRPGSGARMLVHAMGDARVMVRTLPV